MDDENGRHEVKIDTLAPAKPALKSFGLLDFDDMKTLDVSFTHLGMVGKAYSIAQQMLNEMA